MRYDNTIKDLFKTMPQHLLQQLVGKQGVALLPVEFPSTMKRIPDCLFEMEDQSLLHLDLQSKSEPMDWRMLMYYVFIRQRYPNRELVQKVLYLGSKSWRPAAVIQERSLQFRYEVIDIRDIDCRKLLDSPSLEENILAVLCRMENPKTTIREILRRIDRLKPKARQDALVQLMTLSGLRRLETMVQMEAKQMAIHIDVMQNAWLKDLILHGRKKRMKKERKKALQKGIQKGIQQGIQQGVQQGVQQGQQIEATSFLFRLLDHRFSPLPSVIKSKVQAADRDTLEKWMVRAFDARTLQDVFGDK